jgi:O-antigen/teichoic acid export membrane protein
VATLGTALLFLRLVRRWVPWFGMARPDRAGLVWFLGLSGWSMAGDAVAKVALASDVIVLGLLMSTREVTSYVLTAYATQAVVGILSLGLAAAVPGLAQMTGADQRTRAADVRADLLVVAWLSATTVGALVLLWNRSFIDLWVGPEHFAGRAANLLLVLMLLQTVLIRCDASLLNALLRLRTRVQTSAVAAVLACALAAVLVPYFGIPGVCLGMLAGRLVQMVGFPVAVNTALGRTALAGGRAIVRPAAVSVLVLASCLAVEPHLRAGTWLSWAAGVAASGALVGPVLALAGLTLAQRRAMWRRAAHLGAPGGWSR